MILFFKEDQHMNNSQSGFQMIKELEKLRNKILSLERALEISQLMYIDQVIENQRLIENNSADQEFIN
jgi:hypothetical protein